MARNPVVAAGPPNSGIKSNPCESLKRRYDALKGNGERTQFEAHAQEIAEVVSPRKNDFVGLRTAGEKKMNRVLDPTGIHANEMLAAGLHGMATNPSTKWFSLRMVGMRIQSEDGLTIRTHARVATGRTARRRRPRVSPSAPTHE